MDVLQILLRELQTKQIKIKIDVFKGCRGIENKKMVL
ncbi:MAG: hypothetical protein ACJAZP_003089 [Psychromonas sp.]|jgi:hypothetical protein